MVLCVKISGVRTMNIDTEKLQYVLRVMYPSIEEFVDQVLDDSEIDPEYSAVTAANVIKCYIQIETDLGCAPPWDSVEGFFRFNGYTDEEYQRFEEKRQKESQYYIGVQY